MHLQQPPIEAAAPGMHMHMRVAAATLTGYTCDIDCNGMSDNSQQRWRSCCNSGYRSIEG